MRYEPEYPYARDLADAIWMVQGGPTSDHARQLTLREADEIIRELELDGVAIVHFSEVDGG
jgi:hypothetical protein